MKAFFDRVLLLAALSIALSSVIVGQDDIYSFEGMGGYSYMNLNRGIDLDEINDNFTDTRQNRVNAHGFNGSIGYNWSRFLGVKFDVTLHSYGEDFTSTLTVNPLGGTPGPGTFKTSQNVYQYMGGVQIKDNAKDGPKFKPWAHILGGVADQHLSLERTSPISERLFDVNSTDFAMKLGGGIDYRIHKNIDVRLIQADWNPIFRGDLDTANPRFGTLGSVLQNNWLLTFGVVIH